MKSNRHSKILELISQESIDTQEGLLIRLRESGFDVTQATVSRDIRELGIHKVRAENGKYHYVSMQSKQGSGMSGKFVTIFSESVRNIDFAQNIVVIKCFTGMANAVCAALDTLHWSGVVGTLAGDDTIFMVMRDDHNARELVLQLRKMMSAGQ